MEWMACGMRLADLAVRHFIWSEMRPGSIQENVLQHLNPVEDSPKVHIGSELSGDLYKDSGNVSNHLIYTRSNSLNSSKRWK